MKRKNLVLFAAFAVSLSAGCAGNRNPEAVQETAASAAETVLAEATQVQATVAETAVAETAVAKTAMTETGMADTTAVNGGTQPQADPSLIVTETAPGSISMDTAKSIAINDAGVSGEACSYSAAKLDWEDGRQVYDVDFFVNGIEYEYEILASDGSILKKKQDAEWGKNSGNPGGSVAGQLTMDQARQKVAERIVGVDPVNVYIKEDYDDGRLKYEGEVYHNQRKYEFELDAATGAFTDWEEEVKK